MATKWRHMMRIRNIAAVLALTGSALILSATTALAAPFLFGTANDAFGEHIFQYDLSVPGGNKINVYNQFVTNSFFDSLNFVTATSLIYTDQGRGEVYRVNTDGSGNVRIASGLNIPKDLVLEPNG